MLFKSKKTIKLPQTPHSLRHFSLIDKLLQICSYNDGHFCSTFEYFRNSYFNLIDREKQKLTVEERIELSETIFINDRKDLAALSYILKPDIFESYLRKMFSEEEQQLIRSEIDHYSKRIPTDPITK